MNYKLLPFFFERMENSTRWMSKEYNDLSQSFEIAGKTVLVEDIYENALEEKK